MGGRATVTNRRKEYKLEVKIGIQEYDVSYVDHTGAPVDIESIQTDENGRLYVTNEDGDRFPVNRREEWNNGGRLSVEETRNLGAMDFLRLMGVMGEMHKTIDRIE